MPLKALLASVMMASRGAALSKAGMARTGQYSHGSAHKHYNELLETLMVHIPAHLRKMDDVGVRAIDPNALQAEVASRNATIAALRAELAARDSELDQIRRYALALHQRTVEVEEQWAADHGHRVRPIRALD
ncbi:hypothetical protein [Curtobacterium sp. MCBD17_021]|uniref:hypothetical protein n=1 Tax=Curtobacterium sp. MCBD17_021 TaxID=2175665 RepID=UPI0011B40824|nr:hypothetical protein [Curtobacterium sp. MCBD17_021]